MTFNTGDKVVANKMPPVMTISLIEDKKAICHWVVDEKQMHKKFFLTELRPQSYLESEAAKPKPPKRGPKRPTRRAPIKKR